MPMPLNLTTKTPERCQANHSFAFIVDFEGRLSIKINTWLNTLLKFLSRKSFYIKKCFASNNNDSRINEMLYSKVRSDRVINGKKGFRFNIYCCQDVNIRADFVGRFSACYGGMPRERFSDLRFGVILKFKLSAWF